MAKQGKLSWTKARKERQSANHTKQQERKKLRQLEQDEAAKRNRNSDELSPWASSRLQRTILRNSRRGHADHS